MGPGPKEKPIKKKIQSTRTMQRNYDHPVAHRCSSHLLTPTSWWSSQERVPHSRTHNKKSRVS